MKKYTIFKTNGVPDWSAVPAISAECVLWEPDCGVRMAQQLCYDETALYVRQRAKETAVRAEYTAPLSPVHEDSCMEFFFALGEDDRYFNFEINPNACFELGFGPNRSNRIRLCHKDEQETFRARCARTPDGWTAPVLSGPPSGARRFFPRKLLQMRRQDRAPALSCVESGRIRNAGLPPTAGFWEHVSCVNQKN